jgi:ATP-dependent Clp protease ATP-binding subunit ClpB
VIQRRLQDPLAQLILEGKVGEGDTVKVSATKTGLTIDGMEFAVGTDELVETPPAGMALN